VNPAIVIPCYKRNFSLERLLDSLSKATFSVENIPLIISIDGPGNELVKGVAEKFNWKFGPKEIHVQEKHLGLKQHMITCTNLVNKYENILLLEDDLLVSPHFYEYAIRALDFYKEEEKLAGISLYNYEVTESTGQSFRPLDDGSDVYFLQHPSSWGQVFTKKQWNGFMDWNKAHEAYFNDAYLPSNVKGWGVHSWKKHFVHYMAENDLYFVYPRLSFTTNLEGIGTHSNSIGTFQTTLQESGKSHVFNHFSQSKSIYDAWFEIKPLALNKWIPHYQNYDYEVDLFGTKDMYKSEFILAKKRSTAPMHSYSAKMQPALQNVLGDIEGTGIEFTATKNIINQAVESVPGNRFSIVVPVIRFNETELGQTLHSIFTNGYPNMILVLSVNQKIYEEVYIFIIGHFSRFRYDIHFTKIDTDSLGACIKQGFDELQGGIATWLNPGSKLEEMDIIEAGKIFNDCKQVNWLLPVGFNDALDNYRINKEMIFHFLKKKHHPINTELVFFRVSCWKKISAGFSKEKMENELFFNWLFFFIVWEFDLNIVISDIGGGRRAPVSFLPPIKGKQLWNYASASGFTGPTRKMKAGFLYKILKGFSQLKIPVFRNMYYLFYDLPLIVRRDEKNKRYYFSKK
jgi:hypothetical protein